MDVLVVEDEPLIAMHVESMLTQLGYDEIRCAPDMGRAFELLLTRLPRFAVLDIRLSGNRVFPFAAALRRRGVPMVFCSAISRADLPAEWAIYPFVPKPLDARGLAAAIKALKLGDEGSC